MNAWLITWECDGDIVAILSSRKSEATVAELVKFLYLASTSTADELAYYANRPNRIPYKIKNGEMINGIPHGERITCGQFKALRL